MVDVSCVLMKRSRQGLRVEGYHPGGPTTYPGLALVVLLAWFTSARNARRVANLIDSYDHPGDCSGEQGMQEMRD